MLGCRLASSRTKRPGNYHLSLGKKKPVRGNGRFESYEGKTREFSVVGYRKFTIKLHYDEGD
jgi:hypothetical protein